MAFGKKKQRDEAPGAPAPEAALEVAPEAAPDEQPEGEPLDASTSGETGAAAPEGEARPPEPAVAGKTEAAADPLGGDLLNMFQATKIEAADLSVVLGLAGDVEIDDLLEELHTVALALGCQLEEVRDDESDLLAA